MELPMRNVAVAVVVLTLAASAPAVAQIPAATLSVEAEQVTDAISCAKCRLKTDGRFVIDASRRVLEFDRKGTAVATIPSDRVTAVHWEASHFPQRARHRETYYLTIEYTAADGGRRALSVRLASNAREAELVESLHGATGRSVDSSVSSLAGVPFYARLGIAGAAPVPVFGSLQGQLTTGTEVFVEVRRDDGAGYGVLRGRLATLSSSQIVVSMPGDSRVVPAADVLGITTKRSTRLRGLVIGLIAGAIGSAAVDYYMNRADGGTCCWRGSDMAFVLGAAGIVGGLSAWNSRPQLRDEFVTTAKT